MCASRFDLVEHFPRGGRVAEIGTHEGVFARHILKTNAPQELHLVDADMSFLVGDVADDPAVTLHCGLSHQILQSFQEDYFDWIYIDADHSFAGVSRDADLASTKIRPGGYLVFNDFAHADQDLGQYGVHRAVVDFSIQNEWPFVWWAYEPSGLYDVALQRPQ
ncbi:MAG: class I SAM-dependent methyltransferase [Methyloligella sp. ZOD6]